MIEQSEKKHSFDNYDKLIKSTMPLIISYSAFKFNSANEFKLYTGKRKEKLETKLTSPFIVRLSCSSNIPTDKSWEDETIIPKE